MKIPQFNAENKGHQGVGYPLFLGAPLGLTDTINVQYPQLEELYQIQLSQMWNEFEVDLTQDKMDMLTVPAHTTDLMVKTIMWQFVADSVASRSIIETLGKYISNSELINLATLWSFFEVIHARTYSHIVKQTFTQPNDLLNEIYDNAAILQRSAIIIQTFDDMAAIDPTLISEHVLRKQILKTITALFALEAIAFMSSFAVTFAVTETGVFQGTGQLVKLICRDEVLHTRMDYGLLHILQKDSDWDAAFEDVALECQAILDAVVQQELIWADYLFSEGRRVVGLNAELLKEYTCWMSKPVYDAYGLPFVFPMPSSNPLPYMDSYIDSTKVQTAAQELQIVAYNVGAIVDDTDDLDLGDF